MAGRSAPFERGFKARTQRLALEYRTTLGVPATGALDPRVIASHLGVQVRQPEDVPSLTEEDLGHLVSAGSGHWSAVSLPVAGGHLIVYNPTHSPGRVNNTLAHEVAHLLLDHRPATFTEVGDCPMRDYDDVQEREADWLAGSLLLPIPALRLARSRGWDLERTAQHFGTSEELARWRWNQSGVDRYIRPT